MEKLKIHKATVLLIASYALPIIIETSLQMLIGWVDTIMISRRLGEFSFNGVDTANSLLGIITLVLMVLVTGSSILIAQYVGAKDKEKSSQIARQSILFMVISSLVLMIPLIFLGKNLLKLMPIANEEIISQAHIYLRYIVLFLPIQALMMLLGGIIKSTGDTKRPMFAMVGVNIANTALNYFFLYGIPFINIGGNSGIEGPALASGISRSIGLVFLVYIVYQKNFALSLKLKEIFKANLKILTEITTVGIPAGLEQIFYRGSMFLHKLIIMSMGSSVQAAAGYSSRIEGISFIPIFGLSMAVSILVGQKIGGKDIEKAKEITDTSVKISIAFMIFAGLTFIIGGPFILRIFTLEKNTIATGTTILYMIAFAQPAKAINMSLNGTFRGAGNTKWVMWVTFSGTLFVCVGLGFLLGIVLNWGIYGLWAAVILDEWLRAAINWYHYKTGNWASYRLVDSKHEKVKTA
ncbi:MATE family efflux transporter [Proteinivorax hydrogeniformans]|uniref:Probable multidrug resistance protein NorM n=1 Tax=Proteinivorax hydrogeniformans TaxID=1826727 RepID=A0AAU8HR87_9FIRM